jgi:hypothetical protein
VPATVPEGNEDEEGALDAEGRIQEVRRAAPLPASLARAPPLALSLSLSLTTRTTHARCSLAARPRPQMADFMEQMGGEGDGES